MSAERLAGAACCEASWPEFGFFEMLLANVGAAREPDSTDRAGIPGGPAIRAAVASTRAQRADASDLVQRRYAWRGYATEPSAVRVPEDRQVAETLVALRDTSVVGTMTLGFDGPDGLWIDRTYPAAILLQRTAGRRLCEITRLAIASRQDTGSVLAAMFALAYRVGRSERRATDLYVEVHPRHARLYRRLFGFSAASDVRECGRVKAPAILLHLDIQSLDERMAVHFARRAAVIPGIRA